MRIRKKDLKLLSEAYDNMTSDSSNQEYKVGDIVNGYDGEEVIVSIQSGSIYTRVLAPEGNAYTEEELKSASAGADESEEGMSGEDEENMGGEDEESTTPPPREKLRFQSQYQKPKQKEGLKRTGPPTSRFRPFSQTGGK